MARMKRGVGYCENTECEDYAKGVFLLNHGDTFYCPAAGSSARWRRSGFYTGNPTSSKRSREISTRSRDLPRDRDRARREPLGPNNVYTLQSPLIKTEALKVAEASSPT